MVYILQVRRLNHFNRDSNYYRSNESMIWQTEPIHRYEYWWTDFLYAREHNCFWKLSIYQDLLIIIIKGIYLCSSVGCPIRIFSKDTGVRSFIVWIARMELDLVKMRSSMKSRNRVEERTISSETPVLIG